MFGYEFVAVSGESADGFLVFGIGFIASDLDNTPWGEIAVVDNEISTRADAHTQSADGVFKITEDGPDGDHQDDINRVGRAKPIAQVSAMELASVAEAFFLGVAFALFDKRREGIHADDMKAEMFAQRQGDDITNL